MMDKNTHEEVGVSKRAPKLRRSCETCRGSKGRCLPSEDDSSRCQKYFSHEHIHVTLSDVWYLDVLRKGNLVCFLKLNRGRRGLRIRGCESCFCRLQWEVILMGDLVDE
jgi:hypothetical protein